MRRFLYCVSVLLALAAGCRKENVSPDPGPKPVPGVVTKYQISLVDGVCDYGGVQQMASGTVRLTDGSDAYYDISYSIDGGEHAFNLKNVLVGKLVDFQWPDSLCWGRHTVSGSIVCEESAVEPVQFRDTFWMKGSRLRDLKASLESKYRSLSPSEGETAGLSVGETGVLGFAYEPAATIVVSELLVSDGKVFNVNYAAVENGPGFVRYPFSVLDTGLVSVRCVLWNGPADSIVRSFRINTGADRPHTVMEVSVPGNVSFRIGDEGAFTVGYFPEDAKDARIESVKTSSPDLVASVDGMAVRLSAKNVGDYTVTVLVGDAKIAGTVKVKVIGTMVSDIYVEEELDGKVLAKGDEFVFHVNAVPQDAFDASTFKVVSTDAEVLSVTRKGGNAYVAKAAGYGGAEIVASAGTGSAAVEKRFRVDVLQVTAPDVVMNIGETATFSLKVIPSDSRQAYIREVEVSSPAIKATFEGLAVTVTATNVGDYRIKAVVGDAGVVVPVSVKVDGVLVSDIIVEENLDGRVLTLGEEMHIHVNPVPSDAYDAGTLVVKSSDSKIVSVSKSADRVYVLKAVGCGRAAITASAGSVIKVFNVDVLKVDCPESVTFDVKGKGAVRLSASPSDSKEAFVASVRSSAPELVAVINGFGVDLTASYPGEYSLDLAIGNIGIRRTVKVVVTGKGAEDIALSENIGGLSLLPGQSKTVTVSVSPADAFDAGTLKMESSDPGVMSVGSLGGSSYVLRALTPGKATIVATVGKVRKEYAVETFGVTCPESVSFDITKNDGRITLSAVPSNSREAFVKSVTTSSADLVAAPNGFGVVLSAKYPGEYTVKVVVGNIGIEKNVRVSVSGVAVSDISASGISDGMTILAGRSRNATISTVPAGAFDAGTLSVTSSDAGLLKVVPQSGGVYTLVGSSYGGRAVVTAKAGRGVSKSWTVDVFKVSANESMLIRPGEETEYTFTATPKDNAQAVVTRCTSSSDYLKVSVRDGRVWLRGEKEGEYSFTVCWGTMGVEKTCRVVVHDYTPAQ